jgi:hypothetical protein
VDLSWDSPSFYMTSAFTDGFGQVTFRDVPEVAEVNIQHPGGNYMGTVLVPQLSTIELRLILETFGENKILQDRLENPQPARSRSSMPTP